MAMRESKVEARLTAGVKRLGGMSIKIAPVMAGAPDRLILLPGSRMHLVEVKAKGGRLRPIQQVFHDRAAELGIRVEILSGPDQVDVWLHQQEGSA
jgi:hypothetical protein